FEQTPMIFKYPERQWIFYIQPLSAANFVYSLETIAPKWSIRAHIVDRGLNATELRDLVVSAAQLQAEKFGSIKLSGNISPDSGNPELNPFIAPVRRTKSGKDQFNAAEAKFKPQDQKEVISGVEE